MIFVPRFCLVLFAMVLLFGPFGAVASFADDNRINVLIISSFPKDIPAQLALEKGLKDILRPGSDSNLFFEFMDVPRLGGENFPGVFAQYLTAKYGRIKLDFLVGWAYDAINFVHGQPEIFPTAERLFFEVQLGHNLSLRGNEKIIGVKNDFRASFQDMLRMENPRHIVVIGTTQDLSAKSRLVNFKTVLAELGPDIETEYLLDRSLEEVTARLAALPRANTLAFYLLMFSDGRGTPMTPYAVVEHLAEHSAVPIYSFWESLMGSGIVGGYLISQEVAGQQLSAAMLAIHRGEAVGDLSPMRRSYDWTAVKKWGIPPDRIPPGAILLNRPPELLEKYFWQIAAVVVFCALESLLIVVLVLNRIKRRKVERELTLHRDRLEELVAERTDELHELNRTLLASEERFKTLSDAAFEGLLLLEEGIIFDANRALLDMTGYASREVIGRQSIDFVDAAHVAEVEAKMRSDYARPFDTILIGKDGIGFPVKLHARTFSFKERHIRVIAIHDLREQKKAEEEIKALRGILPICASCKKIRDDKGYWKQLEEYIESHTDALFSHGLCADCKKELYGNQEWFRKRRTREKDGS